MKKEKQCVLCARETDRYEGREILGQWHCVPCAAKVRAPKPTPNERGNGIGGPLASAMPPIDPAKSIGDYMDDAEVARRLKRIVEKEVAAQGVSPPLEAGPSETPGKPSEVPITDYEAMDALSKMRLNMRGTVTCMKCKNIVTHGIEQRDLLSGHPTGKIFCQSCDEETKKEQRGLRYNLGKPRHSLISPWAMEGLARVLTYGANKYAPDNWRRGLSWRETIDSLKRHLDNFEKGIDFDMGEGGSQLPHIDHLLCNAMFLSEFFHLKRGTDDRWKP